MAASPSNGIERAHMMFRDGWYEEALRFYTEAIDMAKNKAQKIALHSNRAACYLKLHNFKKAAEECTSVLDHKHIGALMLRAQTLVTLNEYHSALFDINRLLELNPSSEVYQNLQARLKTQLSLAPIPESEEEFEDLGDDDEVILIRGDKGEANEKKCAITSTVEGDKKDELGKATINTPFAAFETDAKLSSERKRDQVAPKMITAKEALASKAPNKESSEQHSRGWQSISQPKGHSALDYTRWDSVEDDSSDDDDEESMPQYQFRVRTIGVSPVKQE